MPLKSREKKNIKFKLGLEVEKKKNMDSTKIAKIIMEMNLEE